MYKTTHYTITRENLPIHEWIGLFVKIVESSDSTKKGLQGEIVDETQRIIILETSKGEKKVPKVESVFAFEVGTENVEIEGKNMLYSPIERLKNGGKFIYA